MKTLLDNWEEVKSQISFPFFLVSDYDGTLTPIMDRPDEADLSGGMRENLAQLSELTNVAIVSGRKLSDLKKRVGVEDIYYSGNHGFRIKGPGASFTKEEAELTSPIISEISREIKEKTRGIDGVIIEDKGLTASVHYRLVQESEVQELKQLLEDLLESYQEEGLIETMFGKKVLEIRPNLSWDKGKAVLWLLESVGIEDEGFVIYLGDDETDEDAFQVIRNRGIGVLVSEEEMDSLAQYRLQDVKEVNTLLSRLIELLRDKKGKKHK
ncbi:MAG: trehalose-phosphatase [Hadesarchaea archaeon]|nr:trehalose-phosphatase [Hadesarchaea archaeon]